jgi:hypothetical protein
MAVMKSNHQLAACLMSAVMALVIPAKLYLITIRGAPGESCVLLVDANNVPLAKRCSRGLLET